MTPSVFPDAHLQSAIKNHMRSYLTSFKSNVSIPPFILNVIKSCPVPPSSINPKSEKYYGKLMALVFKRTNVSPWVRENIPTILDSIKENVAYHVGDTILDPLSPNINLEAFELSFLSSKCDWEDYRTYMQSLKSKGSTSWMSIKNEEIGISRGYICSYYLLVFINSEWVLFDYDQVMMICDTISSRVFTILYHNFLRDGSPGKCDQANLLEIYSIWDKCLEDEGNLAYNQIKMWESIILAIMFKSYDPLQMSSDYYEWVTEEIIKQGFMHTREMINLIERMRLSKCQLAEVFGIYRHWGHPTVDENAGCKKVKKIAKNRPYVKYQTLRKMVALMKRQFAMSYIGMHGKWPNIALPKDSKRDNALARCIKRNSICVNLYSPLFRLEDWYHLRFEKEFDFDYFLDFSELIDDKALSTLRKDIRSIYNPSKLGYKPGKATTSRRVLLEALRRPSIDIKDICNKIMWRKVPDDWKIILLHPKEREMKIAPRLFAMMTLEMRLYFCVTEKNLSNVIFKYYPQQTMTMSESDLMKRLYAMGSLKEADSFLPIITSIDFQSWNIHWQYTSTQPFFAFFDSLFGTPGLFTYTHTFFQEACIALCSHHNPPTSLIGKDNTSGIPKECDTLWYEHRGGFEGLRQKGWTLITICLLLLVEYDIGIKSYIVGQGDNQVCKLMIPKVNPDTDNQTYILTHQSELRETIRTFIIVLKTLATDIGLIIKSEESWVSSSLISYSKDFLFDGAFLPQASKKMSRTMVDVNEIYPILFMKISTLQTTGLSAAQKGLTLIEPYCICQLETITTIIREVQYPLILKGKRYSADILKLFSSREFFNFVLHMSSDIGGCPIIPLLSYYYRGHPDPLTTYTTQLTVGAEKGCYWCKKFITYLAGAHYSKGEGDPELLISNPTSLNIRGPTLLSNVLRKFLETTILSQTKNKDIRYMFSSVNSKLEAQIYRFLISSSPMYPRVLHEIVRNSQLGVKLNFIAKFSNNRTTQLMMRDGGKNLQSKIEQIERGVVHFWFDLYNKINILSASSKVPCSTRLAQQLRDHSWGEVLESKIEGVTIPHPIHQFSINRSKYSLHKNCLGSPEYIIFTSLTDISNTLLTTRGPYSPYLGSHTKEKVTGKIYQIAQSGRPLESAQRLNQLRSWCIVKNSPLDDYLLALIESRTNLPLEVLELTSGYITSGSLTHRLNDHSTKRGTLTNYRPNSTTHIYVSTDNMGKYSRGQDNFNIHFQGALHLGYAVIHLDALSSNLTYSTLHLHIKCLECEERIDDLKMVSYNEVPPIVFSTQNRLLYSTVENLPQFSTPKTSIYRIRCPTNGAEATGILLASRLIKHINQSVWGISEMSSVFVSPIGVKEIKKYKISQLLDHCALYLYLYLYEDRSQITQLFSRVTNHEVWRDISHNCLLPEVLPDLVEAAGDRVVPDMYYTNIGASRLLNKALFLRFTSIHKRIISGDCQVPCFYLVPGCGIKRIIIMWGNFIECYTRGEFNPGLELSKLINIDPEGIQLPNPETSKELYSWVHSHLERHQISLIMMDCRLKLSNHPPEIIMSRYIKSRLTDTKDKKAPLPAGIRPINVQGSFISCVLLHEETRSRVLVHERKRQTKFSLLKGYEDHQFGLIGKLSCSFLKVLEILSRLDIRISKPCIAIADGEGGIGELLSRLSNCHTYHNSLIDRGRLILHRGANYIPGAYVTRPQMVRSAELSALYGGDITDQVYLRMFLESIGEDEIGLLSFDAESTIPFDPEYKLLMLSSVVRILNSKVISHVIYKTYIDDERSLLITLDALHQMYNDVRLVTTIFSSNETYEVHIVATERSGSKIIIDGMIDSSVMSFSDRSYQIGTSRIKEYPHQVDNEEWRDIILRGLELGYGFNITYYMEKFVDDLFVYDGSSTIREWFDMVLVSCDNNIKSELFMINRSSKGEYLSKSQRALMASSHVVHKNLEMYIKVVRNIIIIKDVLKIDYYKEVISTLNSHIQQAFVYKVRNKFLYELKDNGFEWKSQYLKIIWRIWGYVRHSKLFE